MDQKKRIKLKFILVLLTSIMFITGISLAKETFYTDNWGEHGFNLINANSSEVEIVFSMEKFHIDNVDINGDILQSLTMPGVFLPNNEGAPDLPGFSRYIAIPQGSNVSLEIIAERIEKYYGLDITPAPKIPLETEKGPLVYKKNQDIYTSNTYYPEQPIKISSPQKMRGVDVVLLGITPFQYNPVTKELKVLRDIHVKVSFSGGNGKFGDNSVRSRWWDPILSDLLMNYSSLPRIDYSTHYRGNNYEYIIIIPNNPIYYGWADSLKDFRIKQGINTDVVTLSEIGANSSTAIENYINSLSPMPAGVLIMADYGTGGITGNGIFSPVYNGDCISDNIYADVNGDDLPDIAFSRMTAQTENQLEIMVEKILNNEQNPPTNSNFYDYPITAMGWQTSRWFQICSESINGFWEYSLGKNPVRENAIHSGSPGTIWSSATNTNIVVGYFGPDGLGYIPANTAHLTDWGGNATRLNNDINSGAFMLQHRDHGGVTGWSHPDYDVDDLPGLYNDDLVFVFSINCLTGKFNSPTECFAEALHRYEHRALGVLAATETSYSFVNDTYVWGAYDNMWPEFMPDYTSTPEPRGILPAFGNCAGKYFLQQSSWPYNTAQKEITYYLFHHHGDPFSTVYTEFPQDLTVTHDDAMLSGVDYFNVAANEGALIALTVDCEIIGVGEGNGLMPTTISIPPQLPGTNVLVTVTKQNYYRYEQNVTVIPPDGPYVIFDSYTINDIDGNNNGEADYGEDIKLNVSLKNVGIADANNVIASISCSDNYITITDSTENYGTIGAGLVSTIDDAFSLSIANDIPDQYDVVFDLDVEGTSEDSLWESTFTMTINAPLLSVGELTISDPSGNNNGRLDPGETADIIIEALNEGNADSPEATGTLISTSNYVTVNNPAFNIGVIEAGSSGIATFNVTVDDNTPIGTLVSFDFEVIAGCYDAQELFYESIGLTIEDFETGDFSDFEWEFGGDADWTISSDNPYEGAFCAKSGYIGHNSETELYINANFSAGEISFYRKVSSEAGYDYLKFYIDDVQQDQWSGSQPWSEETFSVDTGNHTFKWVYEKDVYVSSGQDCAWIDYIIFPPILAPDPVFYLNPVSLDFGEVFVGDDSTQQFTIKNLGSGELAGTITTPYGYTVAESDSSSSGKNTIDYCITMGGSQTYDLTFAPEHVQSYNSNVRISIDPFQMKILSVTGEGIPLMDLSDEITVFTETKLLGNFPNPMFGSGKIKFQLKGNSNQQNATIKIYDIKGKLVQKIDAKDGVASIDTNDLANGIYFYRLTTDNYDEVKKMIVVK